MADSSTQLNAKFPSESPSPSAPDPPVGSNFPYFAMSFGERAISAAGAAALSAIIVNPLDVAKTRLQAQAAGILYHPTKNCIGGHMAPRNTLMFSDFRCSASCTCDCLLTAEPAPPPQCSRYKRTFDVLFKVARQEGYARLWRGTNASLVLAILTVGIYLPCYDIFQDLFEEFAIKNSSHLAPYAPLIAGSAARSLACISCYPIELARTRMQAFRELQTGGKSSGILKTLLGVLSPGRSTKYPQNFGGYRVLWTGVGAQLARDVPFSAICWSTLEPIRRSLLGLVKEEGTPIAILGANFTAGFVAGILAAAATCPLDVAKTRRQIEKDPTRAQNSSTWRTLSYVWRSSGLKGLFIGVGPRVGRAGPSVGIVVSSYEMVKNILHNRHKKPPESYSLGSLHTALVCVPSFTKIN